MILSIFGVMHRRKHRPKIIVQKQSIQTFKRQFLTCLWLVLKIGCQFAVCALGDVNFAARGRARVVTPAAAGNPSAAPR